VKPAVQKASFRSSRRTALHRRSFACAGLGSFARLDNIFEAPLVNIEMNKPKIVECGVQLAPSILAADFARLSEQVAQAEEGGVAAGANVLVAGSAIFGADDGLVAAIKWLRAATKQAAN
jgi:hypothetical protein